eukprot:390521-Rhodomonas_salina.1
MVHRLGRGIVEREGAKCAQPTPGQEIDKMQSPFLSAMLGVDASGGRELKSINCRAKSKRDKSEAEIAWQMRTLPPHPVVVSRAPVVCPPASVSHRRPRSCPSSQMSLRPPFVRS